MGKYIIEPLENEKYQEYIKRILDNRPNKKDKENYQERHHIVPRSKGGSNDEENLIFLYPAEHYYAHMMLSLENPSDIKLARAWWLMSHLKTTYNDWEGCTAEQYDQARTRFYAMESERLKGKPMPEKCRQKALERLDSLKIKVVCVETGIEYSSFTEAAKKTGIKQGNIRHSAVGERQSAGGYHWKIINPTEEQEEKFNNNRERLDKKKQYKPIICLDSGKTYDNCRDACLELEIDMRNLSAVLNGKRDTVKGMRFDFLFPTEEEKEKIKKNKEKLKEYKNNKPHKFHGKIKCVETGEIYKNQAEAALDKNIHSQNLSAVLVGKQKTAGGFHWIVIDD